MEKKSSLFSKKRKRKRKAALNLMNFNVNFICALHSSTLYGIRISFQKIAFSRNFGPNGARKSIVSIGGTNKQKKEEKTGRTRKRIAKHTVCSNEIQFGPRM